jgi:hypothetical protein
MHTKSLKGLAFVAAVGVAIATIAPELKGYVLSGRKWAATEVVYYVNPTNIYVSQNQAIAAIQSAAATWSTQSNANIRLVYGGMTNVSTSAYDHTNNVMFRNDAGGGYTYNWWNSSNQLVDSDIILYEASRPMFAGTSGCSGGIYIEDLATHEFGHMLGLQHSGDGDATMYPSTGYCDMNWRDLSADDISGIEAIYPPSSGNTQAPAAPSSLVADLNTSSPTSSLVLSWSDNSNNESGFRVQRSADGASFTQIAQVGSNTRSFTDGGLAPGTLYYYRVFAYNSSGTSPSSNVAAGQTEAPALLNTAPSVSIGNPVSGGSYSYGSSITFSGNASDAEDGNLTSSLQWRSSIDGALGTGTFSRALTVGTHTITASATDSSNLTGWANVTITVAGTQSGDSAPSLSARGYKVKTASRVELTWSGSSAGSIDVYRNGSRLRTTTNDGVDTDSITKRGGTFVYKLCNAGTSSCSNEATITF